MKAKALIPCTALLLMMAGCAKGQTDATPAQTNETNETTKKNEGSTSEPIPAIDAKEDGDEEPGNPYNPQYKLYDKDSNVIGQIECYGFCTLLDNALFYPNLATGCSYEDNSFTENFYLYDLETGKKSKLGTIENLIGDAYYDRVLINDHLYMIVSTGHPFDTDTWTFNLVDFDLKEKTMDILISEKDDYRYHVLDSIDDDLLLVRHNDGISSVKRYDIETKTLTELKEFTLDYQNDTGETIYEVYYDEVQDSIYALRCQFINAASCRLFVDQYDKSMALISSTDISDAFNFYGDETDESEKRQPVFGFICQNGYLYYESRSTTRLVGKLEKSGFSSLVKDNSKDYGASLSVAKNSSQIVFNKPFLEGCPLYVLDTNSGEMKETSFSVPDDDRFCIYMACQYADRLLLDMIDKEFHSADEREPRLYLVTIEDLFSNPAD